MAKRDATRAKRGLLTLAAVRVGLSLLAFPSAPFFFRHHFVVLVAMRPSATVLFIGALLARHGEVNLLSIIAAAVPLELLAVWLYFGLGRRWQHEIETDDELPTVTSRLLRPSQIRRLRKVLKREGPRFVMLARFAVFPTGLLAATAGATEMEPRRFFVPDGAALALSNGIVIGAGYLLGIPRQPGQMWIVVVGVAGLVALAGGLTVYLRRLR